MAKVSLRAYNREIETMIDRGQFDEAIAHCRHVLKTYPKHLETYRLLGKAYLESRRYGDATDIFSRILATVANDFVAQVGMSIIRDEENKLDDAIWHMERAFETQPSNPAIQAELQRLYARRDGVKPPRIRMTRGALANMYVQGELYPQAISEIKSVLKDDPERVDMQTLLARALYRSGARNEAADMATSVLRRYPYSLDANRVLVEILGTEHPETAQMYRQRVFELDPYATQVTGSIFLASAISDAAVNVERLDWDGQPVVLQTDWSDRAISPEEGAQPDWSEPSSFGGIQSDSESIFGAPASPEPPPIFGDTESAPASIFGAAPPAEQPPAEQEGEIPAFMRAVGWGAATGAFDESKSAFGEEEAVFSESIEHGDLPDWVRAMKPVEPKAPEPEQEEELPDWIKTIGAGAIASQAFDRGEKQEQPDQPEATSKEETTQWLSAGSTFGVESEDNLASEFAWLSNPDETGNAPAESKEEDLDWIKSLDAGATASEEVPNWLKGRGEPGAEPVTGQTEGPDWLKGLGTGESEPLAPQSEEPDWLKSLGEPKAEPVADQTEDLDWLKGLAIAGGAAAVSGLASKDESDEATETPVPPAPAVNQSEEPDWLKSLGGTETEPSTPQAEEPDWLKGLGETETPPASKQEDAPDWLKALGEPQSMPSSSDEGEPDWLKGLAVAGGAAAISQFSHEDELDETKETALPPSPAEPEADFVNQLTEEPVLPPGMESTPSAVDLDQLGTSEQERDDSFAWLEGLAAKQGATEGLLTNPEERLEEEPDWVRQAKGLTSEPQVSAEQPAASMAELGKSEQDQDDAFAWLESLAAKQGATEGLLTKPEDRLEEEPDWVRQAKELNVVEPAADQTEDLDWLKGLAVAGGAAAVSHFAGKDESDETKETPELEQPSLISEPGPESEPQSAAVQPAPVDEVDAWLKNLEGEGTSESASATDETAIWLKGLEQEEVPQAQEAVETPGADLPDWLNDVPVGSEENSATLFAEEAELTSTWMPPAEEPAPTTEAKAEEDALPSWLGELEKDEEQEQIATPAVADDLPAWLLSDETAPAVPEPTIYSDWKPVEETREEPAPEPLPAAPFEMAEAETVMEPEQPRPEPAPVMEVPKSKPEPQPEAIPQRETAGLNIPTVDPILEMARDELSQNNVNGALGSYGKLIKKARYLDEVIYDLREALYRYPVDVNLWQSLGDAYMRANRLQDALDAYTKAEELLR
jgi:tetratricopeptide (TPR) repeat protein